MLISDVIYLVLTPSLKTMLKSNNGNWSMRPNNVDIKDVMGKELPTIPLKQWLSNPYIQKLDLGNNFVKLIGVLDHNNEYVSVRTEIGGIELRNTILMFI